MRSPASWRRNLLASAFGSAWIALVQVAFIPAYIAILGVEAWGFIGALAFLLALCWVLLDAGISQAVTREVARGLAGARPSAEVCTVIRSVEVVLLGAAVAVVAALSAVASWVVEHWFRFESLERSSAVSAVQLLGVQLAFGFLVGLYRAVVAAAQDLVWMYSATAAFATLRGAGVVPVLVAWPTLEAFFAFHAVVVALEAAMLEWKSRRVFRGKGSGVFSVSALAEIHRCCGGTTLVAVLFLLLAQADVIGPFATTVSLPTRATSAFSLSSST